MMSSKENRRFDMENRKAESDVFPKKMPIYGIVASRSTAHIDWPGSVYNINALDCVWDACVGCFYRECWQFTNVRAHESTSFTENARVRHLFGVRESFARLSHVCQHLTAFRYAREHRVVSEQMVFRALRSVRRIQNAGSYQMHDDR